MRRRGGASAGAPACRSRGSGAEMLRRDGDGWCPAFDAETVRLRDVKELRYLAPAGAARAAMTRARCRPGPSATSCAPGTGTYCAYRPDPWVATDWQP